MRSYEHLNTLINLIIAEDLGDGDHTSLSCIPGDSAGRAKLLVKETGILSGVEFAAYLFQKYDPGIKTEIIIRSGTEIHPGDIVFTVSGNIRSLLAAERPVLNFLQRMSGIATLTKKYTDCLHGLRTKVLDTRKTSPGLRELEKEAVRAGGGMNHRMGLYDMILIKDNHVDFAGGIAEAIRQVNIYMQKTGKSLQIEIEARNIAEVEKIISFGNIHRIMLDNFSVPETRKAVQLINGRFETESSGGIRLTNVRAYAECGVDYVSVGELTHHISSLDLSLKAQI